MRAVMIGGALDWRMLVGALLLDLVYVALGYAVFLWAFRRARERGTLLASGE